MPKLPKFTLTYDDRKKSWTLQEDLSGRVIRRFDTKQQATRAGTLERAVGPSGGSVKIQNRDGDYEEERTYPGSRDPRKSPG